MLNRITVAMCTLSFLAGAPGVAQDPASRAAESRPRAAESRPVDTRAAETRPRFSYWRDWLPVSSFRLPKNPGEGSPAALLRSAIKTIGVHPDSGEQANEVSFSVRDRDGRLIRLVVSWAACEGDWVVRVGGTDLWARDVHVRLMTELRAALAQLGIETVLGEVEGVVTYSLWNDPKWWPAIEEACKERGWRCHQRDVLQDAYELVVVDGDGVDVGVFEIALSGTIACHLTGAAACWTGSTLRRVLEIWQAKPVAETRKAK
jgi:hypothetical protein